MTLPLALSLFRKQRRAAHYCACHECDLLVAVPRLLEGEQANCPRCGNQLAILPRYPLQRPLVYALTSLIMLLCANVLPFLAINAKGLANSMTLFQAAGVLFDEDYRVLSILEGGYFLEKLGVCVEAYLSGLLEPHSDQP